MIPSTEFIDGVSWPLLGHYVLTPPFLGPFTAEGIAAIADLPGNTREMIYASLTAACPFRWAGHGDVLAGWRDLLVSRDDALRIWGSDAAPGGNPAQLASLGYGTEAQIEEAIKDYVRIEAAGQGTFNIDRACRYVRDPTRFPKSDREKVRRLYRKVTGRSVQDRGKKEIAKI